MLLEWTECFWRNPPLAPVVRDAKAQEFPLLRSGHRAFRLVDLQPQLAGQQPVHTGHDPFAGAAAANVDVAVIRVAVVSMTASGQLLVELIEREVTTPALRNARMSFSMRLSDTRAATRAISKS